MDFKDYINELNDLDNREAKAELETFYTLNSTTFKFFKSIDTTIQELLNQPNVNEIAKRQLEDILPTLVKLRYEILNIDSITYAKGYKTKIDKIVSYIKNQMVVNEVTNKAQNFFELLDCNKAELLIEQKKKDEALKNKKIKAEINLTSLQKAEKIVLEQGTSVCDAKTLWELASDSKNDQVLERIAKENPRHANVKHIKDEYGAESLLEMIASNPNVNVDTCHILAKDKYAKFCLAQNSQTSQNILFVLSQDKDEYVRCQIAENPNTPIELLTSLVYDDSDIVKRGLAHNPNTPINVLWQLYNSGYYSNLANNPSIPVDMFLLLAKIDNEYVRLGLLENPSTPIKIRERLLNKKTGCFIATTCYGDYDAPEVLILRKYRDECLLTNWLGILFVKSYYAISPSIAKCIEDSDKMKSLIRNHFLRPIVKQIQCKFLNKN